MKKSLEYKVLKYLYDNDNGEYLDISHFFKDNVIVARRILKALRDEKYIMYFERVKEFNKGNSFFAKIEFKGLKYLESIKPKPLTLFQKIQLFTTILSISVAVTFGVLNYLLSAQKSELQDQNNLLNSEIVRYKDSINLYKQKALPKKQSTDHNTPQPKN